MATTISAKFLLDLSMQEIIETGGKVGPVTSRLLANYDLNNGTSDGQVDRGYYKRETGIGASTTTAYDVVGALNNTEGQSISMAEVVLVAVRNLSTTATNYLTVGPKATNGFGVVASNKGFWADASDRNVLAADGDSWLVLYCKGGVAAAAGSTDELAVITQGGTSANTWDIMILGRSA